MKNDGLQCAKNGKNDEFYTQLIDIEKEMTYYKDHFKGKVVLCNCDNPKWSNFWRYFHEHFSELGLKKLISTHYDVNRITYKMEYTGGDDSNIQSGNIVYLSSNGDFRSDECIDILRDANIVVTNPPFSLFREYVALLMQYDKKFIILGNQNAVTYKEIFPLIKDSKLWYGASIHSGDRAFRVPSDYSLNAAGYYIDANGDKYIRVKGVRWFTNLDYGARHIPLSMSCTYNDLAYPKYDNYDAINVDKTKEIPMDYKGVIGVPITFLDKWCPEQFEIVNANDYACSSVIKKKIAYVLTGGQTEIAGQRKYARLLIKSLL